MKLLGREEVTGTRQWKLQAKPGAVAVKPQSQAPDPELEIALPPMRNRAEKRAARKDLKQRRRKLDVEIGRMLKAQLAIKEKLSKPQTAPDSGSSQMADNGSNVGA